VLGLPREYCCAGCQAVAEAIRDGGLEEYYRLRTASAPTPSRRDESEDLLLDREELQKSFVRRVGSRCEVSLVLEGVRCPACLWLIERCLSAQPGVVEAAVGYAGESARVVWDPSRIGLSGIRRAVRRIGYEARPFDPSHRAGIDAEAARRGTARLVFAGVLGMMVMNLALAAYFLGGPGAAGRLPLWEQFGRWCALVASAVLPAHPGQDSSPAPGGSSPGARGDGYAQRARARRGLREAPWHLAGAGPVYSTRPDAQSRASCLGLRDAPRSAAGCPRPFAVAELAGGVDARPRKRGRRVDLAPATTCASTPAIVPADGVVLREFELRRGRATGEPWPRVRAPGDAVVAGSCNRGQPVLLRVTRAGEASTLGQIRRLLERGLASRPAFAQLADRLAGRLVVLVLLLAAATAVFWIVRDRGAALPAAVAVLLVTCPCALALATPIALSVAAGRFAAIGVLPARMAAIERLARADTAVFDKTGTLTLSTPVLESVRTAGGLDSETALRVGAALEAASTHPVARALRASGGASVPATEVRADPEGQGFTGRVSGSRWWIGSPGFALGPASAPPEIAAPLASAGAPSRLAAVLTDRAGRAALFTFAEELRGGADTIVSDLRSAGIRRAVLLSGDAQETVARIGESLGFDEAHGGMTASAKLEWIRSREDSGSRLFFVGDGLNDAPTLAAAGTSASFAQAPQLRFSRAIS
jgi:Cu2+-exporting ATPase